jgi:hypothetical protein
VEALGSPRHVGRIDEVKRIFFCGRGNVSPIARLGAPNLDPNPSLDGALRSMAVPPHAVSALRQLQALPLSDEGIGFGNHLRGTG